MAYNLIFGLINGLTPVYSLTSIFAAVFFSIMIKKGYMNSLSKAAELSFWSGIICVFISTPLNLLFSGWKKLVSKILKVEGGSKMSQEALLMLVEEVEEEGSIDDCGTENIL